MADPLRSSLAVVLVVLLSEIVEGDDLAAAAVGWLSTLAAGAVPSELLLEAEGPPELVGGPNWHQPPAAIRLKSCQHKQQ